jgi:hypothetical protein
VRVLMLLMMAGFMPDFMRAGFRGRCGRRSNPEHAASDKGKRNQDRCYPSPKGLHTKRQ